MVRMDVTISETTNTLATKDEIYEQETTVHHWQLKDLLSVDSEENLYSIHDQNIIRYNLKERKCTILQHLRFGPYCMTVGHGYLIAGGVGSWLNLRSLKDNQELFSGTIGDTVNNSLHITESSLGPMFLLCNNDWTIKIFSLPLVDPLDTIEFPDPVNYAAATQSAEYIVAVGDSCTTYLFESNATGYWKLRELEGYSDVGLCCAWDPPGVRFATASQDGYACLWDRRTERLITKFKTEGPCKNVKFCSSSMDLLAFTEDNRVCHLVDMRNFRFSQSLRVDSTVDHDISGICFKPNAQKLYIGTTTCGIHSYNINTRERREFKDGSFI